VRTRRVALFRGINVGRAKRVGMADLRALFASLGYRDVRTLLNSGNVVFTVPDTDRVAPGPRIEEAVATRLGVSSRVTVLSAAEVAVAVSENPLLAVAADPSRLLVTVLSRPADRTRLESLAQQDWAPDVLAIGKRVAYQWCPEGMLASRLATAVGRALGEAATSRNWATMIKLKALVEEPSAGDSPRA
jgi:uncharacterized protein (DUF1697 family)